RGYGIGDLDLDGVAVALHAKNDAGIASALPGTILYRILQKLPRDHAHRMAGVGIQKHRGHAIEDGRANELDVLPARTQREPNLESCHLTHRLLSHRLDDEQLIALLEDLE